MHDVSAHSLRTRRRASSETLDLTASEYEAAHSSPIRFPILDGHEWPEVERVVEQHDGYIVVEKFGEAAATVEAAEVAAE